MMAVIVVTRLRLKDPALLDDWCYEATFVDLDQDSADLPDWQTSYRRLVADGQVASLAHPSVAHQSRDFPPPVEQ